MKKIGEGISAEVYTDGKYAYKKYHKDYDQENMKYEVRVQNEIHDKTTLHVAKYEMIDNHIKMTLFEGDTLAKRIQEEQYLKGFEDFILLQLDTFKFTDLDLGNSFEIFQYQIEHTEEDSSLKKLALKSLRSIKRVYNLCHFDYHPENIMYHHDEPVIIDWTNAKLGNPIMDIASTYIIFKLYAKEYSEVYLDTMAHYGFDREEVENAIPVMAFIRYRETKEDLLRKQLEELITGDDKFNEL